MEDSESLLILDRSVPFVNAVFRILEQTGGVSEAASILRAAEDRNNIHFLTISRIPEAAPLPDELYDSAERSIYQFLTETQMIFGSYEYSQMNVMYQDYVGLWSHRSWGALIAGWANQSNWLGKDDWNYLDFYGGPNDKVIKDYGVWSEAAMQVIQTKCLNELG